MRGVNLVSMPDVSVEVRNAVDDGRFVIDIDGLEAELVYRSEPGRLILVHTEVPDALGGRGLGGRLVRAAIAEALSGGLTLVPWCPFARRWLRDHPDAAAGVTIDWRDLPPQEGTS